MMTTIHFHGTVPVVNLDTGQCMVFAEGGQGELFRGMWDDIRTPLQGHELSGQVPANGCGDCPPPPRRDPVAGGVNEA